MAQEFDFGMIGIGVMGSNLLLNMADNGFAVYGFDLKQERADKLMAAAPPGTVVKAGIELSSMVAALKKPRKIMLLVPAGKPVDDVIESLLPLIEKEDIVIDGGNSYFKDTLRRITYLQDKAVHFFGMGVSGGEAGARFGPSLMPGGDNEAYQYLQPILESIAAKADEKPCVAYMGHNAAGHYVKMVHNGIEYAMMQMISEVYDLFKRGGGYSNQQLQTVFATWNKGPLQSFLIEITADIFRTLDNGTQDKTDFLIDKILDQAGSKGTGKWTSQEAMDLAVALPAIDAAVALRNLSVYKEQRVAAAKLHQSKTGIIPFNQQLEKDVEDALAFCFVMAYTQGLSLLAKASVEHQMNIPLPSVIQVWKAGCIIRSALLGNFTAAFEKNATLPNLLNDESIVVLVKGYEEAMRRVTSLALNAKIPLAAMCSCLNYYDASVSERLPTNLIQAQRDYFGAHTYQRIDKEGVFHTEWNAEK
ncbi:MAG: NADP-dependent phosphogluconate dehydrogenase [Bacteroidota bacterium]